jgi:hypothetical protein
LVALSFGLAGTNVAHGTRVAMGIAVTASAVGMIVSSLRLRAR